MKRVAIIGAGITGLSAAYMLSDRYSVDVYERGEPGGLAGSLRLRGGGIIEKFYHHFFLSDEHLLKLISDLGLEGEIVSKETRMGFYIGDRIYPFATPLDLLRFKPLTLFQKAMFGITTLQLIYLRDWSRLEGINCERFFAKWRSKGVFEKVWKPLLLAKFGSAWDRIPMSWLWGRISARGKSRKQGAETLLYLRGGFKTLFDRLTDTLALRGVKIIGASVDRITPNGGRLEVNGTQYDSVV
jgi:protoporphyrinogen oxidase